MVEIYYNTLQFQASMAYLTNYFETPFDMYTAMAQYYDTADMADCNHSRIQRYRILADFAENVLEPDDEERLVFREIITYDFYRRDYVKNPPEFVMIPDEKERRYIRDFFEKEADTPHYIEGYMGYNARQLHNMLYMNRFTVNFEHLMENGEVMLQEPVYLLFNYAGRNPLDYSAEVIYIRD